MDKLDGNLLPIYKTSKRVSIHLGLRFWSTDEFIHNQKAPFCICLFSSYMRCYVHCSLSKLVWTHVWC